MSSDKNPLISNVAPPTELPNFIVQQQPPKEDSKESKFVPAIPFTANPTETATTTQETRKENDDLVSEDQREELPSMQDIAQALSPLTEGVKNSVLFGWVQKGVKTGVQKAKDSIDKVVTTLDPQMSQLIYSGGNTEIIVASGNDDKIQSVREAFQSVFGRATVHGHPIQANSVAAQPVGFESAELAAKERINGLRLIDNSKFADKVIVAVENFLVEPYKNQWFDVGLLMLSDPVRKINLKSFTQMISIPSSIVTSLESDTSADYDKRSTGFAVTVGAAMSRNLDTPHYEWHKTYTTIDRIDMIEAAAKALASVYNLELQSSVPAAIKHDSK